MSSTLRDAMAMDSCYDGAHHFGYDNKTKKGKERKGGKKKHAHCSHHFVLVVRILSTTYPIMKTLVIVESEGGPQTI